MMAESFSAWPLLWNGVLGVIVLWWMYDRLRDLEPTKPCKRPTSAEPRLHLVGAGPGDGQLLTLAAAKRLRDADVVIADFLIPQEVLKAHVNSRAKVLIATNKTKGRAYEAQVELEEWTLEALQQGLDVVRLKGGDPFLYGRGGEEVEYFCSLGYKVEVIPGISSSLAGTLAAGVPVTTRGFADQVTIATLHGKRDTTPGVPSPYRRNRSVVFLMSVARLGLLQNQLLQAGYPADLGVTIVENATLSQKQRVFHTNIERILDDSTAHKLESPAVILVGGTAGNIIKLSTNIQWLDGGVTFHPQEA